jgi:uncharacterized protein (DUF885 family)
MKYAAQWLLTALMAIVLVVVLLITHTSYFKPLRLDWFYTRVFAEFALDSPELLSSLRVLPGWLDFYSGKLDDVSPAHDRKMMDRMKQDLATLDSYDRADLDREGKLSYDTLRYFLESQVEGEPFMNHGFPVNQMAGIQSALPEFMVQVHQITNQAEAEAYIARLGKFPLKFAQLLESLKLSESKGVLPPRFTVEKVLKQMNEFVATPSRAHPLYINMRDKLANVPAGAISEAARGRLLADTDAALTGKVYPAYRSLIAYFTALQTKATRNDGAWSLPNGANYYAWTVRKHTTTSLSPQQVHDLGLAEVARVGAEMDAILKQQGLAEGSIGTRVQQLAARPDQQYPDTNEGRKAMLAQYQAILDEANQGLDGVFDMRPKLGVQVQAVPAAS